MTGHDPQASTGLNGQLMFQKIQNTLTIPRTRGTVCTGPEGMRKKLVVAEDLTAIARTQGAPRAQVDAVADESY